MQHASAHDSSGSRYAFGPFLVDPIRRTIVRDGCPVPITSKTFDVLLVLLEYRDHTVEKDQLLSLVWPGTVVHENNLPRQVSSLRRALGQHPDRHDYIVTVPGQGYRFVATVDCLPEPAPLLHVVAGHTSSHQDEPGEPAPLPWTDIGSDNPGGGPSRMLASALTAWGGVVIAIGAAMILLMRWC